MTACRLHRLKGPEHLVGVGFRCWFAGVHHGDIACWTKAWNHYASELGVHGARTVVPQLACWVGMVHAHAVRPIETLSSSDNGQVTVPYFCEDECMAVAIVAASQRDSCPGLQACVEALLGAQADEEVMLATQKFAWALADAGVVLLESKVL